MWLMRGKSWAVRWNEIYFTRSIYSDLKDSFYPAGTGLRVMLCRTEVFDHDYCQQERYVLNHLHSKAMHLQHVSFLDDDCIVFVR